MAEVGATLGQLPTLKILVFLAKAKKTGIFACFFA
jgi:hypothetical protein